VTQHAGREGDSRGETLVELLISMTILGITVVALVTGIGTSIVVSDTHRKEAVDAAVVRSYAESIEASVAAAPSSYVPCPTLTTYGSTFAAPAGYTPAVTAVTYWNWNGSALEPASCSSDPGTEKLSLSVTSADSRATARMVLVIRRPCRAADAACS
jgi:type II secretory pathway pseudopilin PulG